MDARPGTLRAGTDVRDLALRLMGKPESGLACC